MTGSQLGAHSFGPRLLPAVEVLMQGALLSFPLNLCHFSLLATGLEDTYSTNVRSVAGNDCLRVFPVLMEKDKCNYQGFHRWEIRCFHAGLDSGAWLNLGFPCLKGRMETVLTFVYWAVSLAERLRGAGLRCSSSNHRISLGGYAYPQSKNFTPLPESIVEMMLEI